MNKLQKNILITGSFLLFLAMALAAVGLAVFVPVTFRMKTVITVMLAALSPLPLLLAAFLWNVLNRAVRQEPLTHRDPLTNLYSQSTFWDFLGEEIERARRQKYTFTIMLVDLDDFQTVNDRYGQEAGDACLVEFSKFLKTAVRKVDIAARSGGDNFMVILPVCDEVQASLMAKRMLENIRALRLSQHDGTTSQLTASIGMAVYPNHARTGESLFLIADSMLHQAKASGKDRVSIPDVEMTADLSASGGAKSFFIMESIKKNLIVPYFQPIVSVHEKKILAYEVLTRIITPDRVVPAMEFIEEAEGMGAIGKIDYMLIDKAFALVKKTGYRGFLFLNLSPKALLLNEFMSTVRRFMARHGVEPAQLVFEITERDTVKNPNLIKKAVLDLKKQGFQLAIDDFGAGYSSFQYLRMFDVDFLKIDGEIIKNMDGNGGMEQSIVSNIAHLAADLGIKTIAEYVETEAILCRVRSARINYAQGYYIQRPQPGMTY